jgi:4-hydroxy-tetrahydrodipicolinate reductase
MSNRICIAGPSGRMGQMLVAAVLGDPTLRLCAALSRPDTAAVGRDVGDTIGKKTGVLVASDMNVALAVSDVIIDFTRPETTLQLAQACALAGKKLVVGTTGLTAAQQLALADYAKKTAIVFAPNMSIAVNVLLKLTRIATELIGKDAGFDIEVIEAHHNKKVDAPSGTALGLGQAIAKGMNASLDDIAVYERYGDIGPRKAGTVGFSTIRGGDIIGDHTVMFAGPGERIELTHRSQSRSNYAAGALRAAKYLADKQTGFFDMQDVLGLK